LLRVVPPITHEPARPLNADEGLQDEPALHHFGRQFVGPVEMGRREPPREAFESGVPILTRTHRLLNDLESLGLAEVALAQPVQERAKPGDGRSQHNAAGPQHPLRFGQSSNALCSLHQMVERSEKQDGIERRIRRVKLAGVAYGSGERVVRLRRSRV